MSTVPRIRFPALPAAVAAALLAAAASPAPAQESPGAARTGGGAASKPPVFALKCSGNEPFWRIDMGPGTAQLQRPAGEEVEKTTFTGTLDSLDHLDPAWHVWRGEAASGDGVDDAARGGLVVIAREEACRDTMRGDMHDARAVVALPGGGTVDGCCTLGAPLATPAVGGDGVPFADFGGKPVGDWSRVLPDLLPAIQACVDEAEAAVQSVLKAWPMNQGMVGVRMKTTDGALQDCVATSGGRVDSLETLPQTAEPLPDQGEPVYLPGRATPPDIDCGRVERVSGPQGEAVSGYLFYGAGCEGNGNDRQ
ncbi:hypothetical protein [Caenispirillum salinarum]|uniref:hypothetical protein n=1 Tax=Caenispirillum salinarum TaxID=859058 RepID=UPI00384A800F